MSGHRDGSFRRYSSSLRLLIGAIVVALLAGEAGDTAAQSISDAAQNLSTDQMQQLFAGQNRGTSLQPNISPSTTILEPMAVPARILPRSTLENIMSARVGIKLTQFGYDSLGSGQPISLPEVGGIQDDYVLGPGDEIIVTLRGQDNASYRAQVDRDGQVVLPRLDPVMAAGRTLGEFRKDILSAIHRAYVSTEGNVTVGRLRQISVLVAGEVGSPGVRTLTGLSTAIDAILVSGGIKKSGSLRDVRINHDGHVYTLDLYAYLTPHAAQRRIPLSDGDRVLVSPLGKVVAVAGWVRQPGIYELPAGQSAMSVRALMDLAGGREIGGRYRLALMHIEETGQAKLTPITLESSAVHDGDILVVQPAADQVVDRATLSGATSLAGGYAIRDGMHVSELLKSPGALGNSPYTLFGIISRRDPRTYLRSLIAFSPVAALSGDNDPTLLSGDVVRVFSMRESQLMSCSLSLYEQRRQYHQEITRNPFAAAPPPIAASMNPTSMTNSGGNMQFVQPGGNVQQNPNANAPVEPGTENSGIGSNSDCRSVFANERIEQDQNQQTNPSQQYPNLPQSMPGANAMPVINNGFGPDTSALGYNPQLTASTSAAGAQAAAAANLSSSPLMEMRGYASQIANAPGTVPIENRTAPNFQEEYPTAGGVPLNIEARSLGEIANQLSIDSVVLLNFLEDHEVTLDGAVRGPGLYIAGPGVNLHDLVMVAGGTVRWADDSGVELISTSVDNARGSARTDRRLLPLNGATLSNYTIKAHDEIRFRELYTVVGEGSVTLEGEVRYPGQYRILRGEHLGDLLKRAGGLTDVAYPYGTVFLRRSVAALEEESFRRTADQVENQLILAMTHGSASPNVAIKLDPGTFVQLQSFIQTLRTQKGLGRISIVADPTLLAAHPDENPLLETNDVVYIPQRPSTVSVLGEVLQPGSFTYKAGLSAQQYLAKAGGVTFFADDSLTYIILPNGVAEQLERGWLPFDSQTIPPGSVIVVPRDVAPLQWSDIIANASQIFSQLAVAGASLAVITTNLK